MPGAGDREGSRSAFCSGIMEEGQAQGQRERQGGWSCAHRRVGTTRMHNDVVKLRAGAVQREANHTDRAIRIWTQAFRHVNFNYMLGIPRFR